MRTLILLPLLLCTAAISTGCATFAHGPRENVHVVSQPPGAAIFVNGEPVDATTPATISVQRRRPVTVRLERHGYAPEEVRVRRRPSKWLWLTFGLCANPASLQGTDSVAQWAMIVGICTATMASVDVLSGAMFAVEKNVNVELRPTAANSRTADLDATGPFDPQPADARLTCVEVVPVHDGVEAERVGAVRLPAPERPDGKQHDMPIAEACVNGGGAAGERLPASERAGEQQP